MAELQGSAAASLDATSRTDFLKKHGAFLKSYQSSLERIHSFVTTFARESYAASQVSTVVDTSRSLAIAQHNARHLLQSLVLTLNAADANRGYVFSGAQVNFPPIRSELIQDWCGPDGPILTLGTQADYFMNGRNPSVQLPLMILKDEAVAMELPLRANDLQDVFRVFHDFLALKSDATQVDIQKFTSMMDGPVRKIQEAIVTVSSALRVAEERAETQAALQVQYEEQREAIGEMDPTQGAVEFYEASESIKAYLQYVAFTLATQKEFREMTRVQ